MREIYKSRESEAKPCLRPSTFLRYVDNVTSTRQLDEGKISEKYEVDISGQRLIYEVVTSLRHDPFKGYREDDPQTTYMPRENGPGFEKVPLRSVRIFSSNGLTIDDIMGQLEKESN